MDYAFAYICFFVQRRYNNGEYQCLTISPWLATRSQHCPDLAGIQIVPMARTNLVRMRPCAVILSTAKE